MFTVFPPTKSKIKRFDTPFALEQDNWNDFSFQTRYLLYAQAREKGSSEPEYLGAVKILKFNQTKSDGLQVRSDFDQLSDEFISVGDSLDYYQRLNSLPSELRNELLNSLRDMVSSPIIRDDFKNQDGWRISLFRDNRDIDGYLTDAEAILTGNFTELADMGLDLSFTPGGWDSPFSVDFDAPSTNPMLPRRRASSKVDELPRRCAVLVGRNGSGKSTLLSRLARVAFASPDERSKKDIKQIGILDPNGVGFMRIITISYSAFDSFAVPGVYETDLEQIAKDIERGEGRFVFCGLRDIAKEVRAEIEEARSRNATDERVRLSIEDRKPSTHLKSLGDLAVEFDRLCTQIEDRGLWDNFERAAKPILQDPSFQDLEESSAEFLIGEEPQEDFLSWSTGHKIAIHVVASIVAHSVDKSLILFDEPETHLHPPLAAALMHGVRIALEDANAFAVIATHSPVVLQETLARHVRVISRIGDTFTISQPKIETFGENTGVLTYVTFGLTSTSTDFHNVLDHLIESSSSVEEVDEFFEPGLSGQARAYVMSKLRDRDIEVR